MAYLTPIPGAVLELDDVSLLNVVSMPDTTVLNDLDGSQEITSYQVEDDDNGAETLEQGDYMAPVVDGAPVPGTYVGSGTIENAGLTLGDMTDSGLGGALALGIQVSVNPIEGDYFADESGNVYFISEEPLSADRIMASISVNLPGTNNLVTLEVPVSELTATLGDLDPTGLLGTVLGDVTDLTQYIMDTAILTNDTDPTASMILDEGEYTVVCFTRGTLIQTEAGLRKIEELQVGDRVLTRDNGLKEICWIGVRKLRRSELEANPKLRPIRIKAGALGVNIPEVDLVVSPQHRVLLRSKAAIKMFGAAEILVPAKQLLQLDGVDVADDLQEVEYYHFLLDQHEIVVANGAETETLYTGEQALKSVSKAAREEIFALFPQLLEEGYVPSPARLLASGRKSRRLVVRHMQHGKPVVMN